MRMTASLLSRPWTVTVLDGDGAGPDAHGIEHGAHGGGADGGLHVILHGEAALEVDTQVDAVTEDGQQHGDEDDRAGDDQADPGTILDFHYASTSFSSAFTLV